MIHISKSLFFKRGRVRGKSNAMRLIESRGKYNIIIVKIVLLQY
jgi:hypothetical protein